MRDGDGVVRLVGEDSGGGVSEDMVPHLGVRFYRGDSARGRSAGLGLGLTVAAAITDLHHDRIEARAGDAGGLRVEIAIPAEPDLSRVETADSGR